MRYVKPILLFAIIVIACGCSTTYYGQYITAKVKNQPIDEFQAGQYVILAFENTNKPKAEGWYWEFWVYFNNKIHFKYYLNARIVGGTRNYYLVEDIPGRKPSTAASFTAKPNYERVKDRLISSLEEKQAPGIN